MIALGLSDRRAVHLASFVTETALVGLVAAVITAVCTAAPARAATGTLDVTFQGSGGPNPYIPSNVGGRILAWNGDTICLTITLPANADGFSAANHTNQPIAVYGGSDCQGTLLNYIGVGATSMGGSNRTFSFQPNG
ncbi:hypothetical protein [Mycobacterium sp.]|uniref:hypothetical protein n=1 Tax=Mycobacterium sp. TaxID=1785 RepID=UPI003F94C57E